MVGGRAGEPPGIPGPAPMTRIDRTRDGDGRADAGQPECAPMAPVLWQTGPIVLRTHDLFSLVAVVVGFGIYYASLRRRGWLDERVVVISLAVLLGGIVGARVVTGWENFDDYGRALDAGVPLSYALMHGNKSLVGALIGGYVAGVLAKRALGYGALRGDRRLAAPPLTALPASHPLHARHDSIARRTVGAPRSLRTHHPFAWRSGCALERTIGSLSEPGPAEPGGRTGRATRDAGRGSTRRGVGQGIPPRLTEP